MIIDEKTITNGIRAAIVDSHQAAVSAGWFSDPETGKRVDRNVPEMLCLIHSELSEALEGYRKSLQDHHLPHMPNVTVELADTLIRIFDLAGYLELDLARAYAEKRQYNETREDHKKEARQQKYGKKF
jgi:NTP pyrophosphatase (non-canonical NTP hydrolase)